MHEWLWRTEWQKRFQATRTISHNNISERQKKVHAITAQEFIQEQAKYSSCRQVQPTVEVPGSTYVQAGMTFWRNQHGWTDLGIKLFLLLHKRTCHMSTTSRHCPITLPKDVWTTRCKGNLLATYGQWRINFCWKLQTETRSCLQGLTVTQSSREPYRHLRLLIRITRHCLWTAG